MFRLLSKESTIFSIPLYILFLLIMVALFNFLNLEGNNIISILITFLGIALGYFCFNTIKLNNLSHLPLFLYTFFIFAFYPGNLDIGIAVTLFINSIILLILTDVKDGNNKKSILIVGTLLFINYIFLPTTWPMILFVIFHIITTSNRIVLQLVRIIFGVFMGAFTYFCFMYFIGFHSWDSAYFPFSGFTKMKDISDLYLLIPIGVFIVYAILDHFFNYYKKSLINRYKYTFILIFVTAQLVSIILYMGNTFEYLLLLALPISIIISRMLVYLPSDRMKENGLWLIVICLILYKLNYYFKYI